MKDVKIMHYVFMTIIVSAFLIVGYSTAGNFLKKTTDTHIITSTITENNSKTEDVKVDNRDQSSVEDESIRSKSTQLHENGNKSKQQSNNITINKIPSGKSVEGRPIEIYIFGKKEKTIIVIGGIHGDESGGINFSRNLAKYLKSVKELNFTYRVVLLPLANPDGFVLKTRTNSHGIDINRNFPTKDFGKGNKSGRYYGGKSPASEDETSYLISVIDKYNPEMILTFHTPMKCVNYDGPAKTLASTLAKNVKLDLKSSIGYATPGSLGTYYGVERNIPVITLEFPPGEVSWKQYSPGILAAIGVKTDSNNPKSLDSVTKPANIKIKTNSNNSKNLDPVKKPSNIKLKNHKITKIIVSKSQNIMRVYSGEEFIKEYIVSTGMKNCSPVGTFKVIGKSSRPGKADLGTRWMAINRWHTRTGRQFGIHGTNEPQYLGQQRSRGCIRLSNADVEELYDETSVNTAIVIQDGQLPDISSNNFAQVASCYQKENTQ